MSVPLGIRVMFTGTLAAASAINGWSVDTDMSDRYLQGNNADTDPGINGGNSSHSHSGVTHGHFWPSHGHTLTISGKASGAILAFTKTSSITYATNQHEHIDSVTALGYITSGTTVTSTLSTTSKPQSTRIIFLAPDSEYSEIPEDTIVLTDLTSTPADYEINDGNNSTTDLNGRFLIGSELNGDGGGAIGSDAHTHTSVSHTHNANNHNHNDSLFGEALLTTILGEFTKQYIAVGKYHHKATNIQSTSPAISPTSFTVNSSSSDPLHIKLKAMQRKRSNKNTPNGIICPYFGSLSSAKELLGWSICDGSNGTPDLRDIQIKITVEENKLLNTGGNNSHTHTTSIHGHGSTAHTHSYTFTAADTYVISSSKSGSKISLDPHTHTSNSMDSTSVVSNTAIVSLNSTDVRHLYRTCIFLKRTDSSVLIEGGTIEGATIQ